MERQPSASPCHDWNERINAECYEANAWARVVDERSRVVRLLNNYQYASFNFGPTLLSWMAAHAPDTLEAIVDADRLSRRDNGGHGNAIAQVYNHIIMPLASPRDKETQEVWGIDAFRHYFEREPDGMHLAEMAVDTETLEVLADHDIKFVILAPHQALRWRISSANESWREDPVDFMEPYLCRLPSGKFISIFFYDGQISQAVAFEKLLDSGPGFLARINDRLAASPARSGSHLLSIAVDGDTFGHHHRHGEMCLAWLINRLQEGGDISLINFGYYLELHPPLLEVEIRENSSWSCSHGIERWRSDCGCNSGSGGGLWHQKWRQPLRSSLDELALAIDEIFDSEGRKIFPDPWSARNSYIKRLLVEEPASSRSSLIENKLLEMERYRQLMFTSCGWFFDDISEIEPLQNLSYALRAIELAQEIAGVDFEPVLMSRLAQAQGNQTEYGTGERVWTRLVRARGLARRIELLLNDGPETEADLVELTRLLREAELTELDIDLWEAQKLLERSYASWICSRGDDQKVWPLFAEAAELMALSAEALKMTSGSYSCKRARRVVRRVNLPVQASSTRRLVRVS